MKKLEQRVPNLRFKGFTNDWEQRKLGEVADVGDGLHGTPKYEDEGEYYFINGNNLIEGRIQITEETKHVSYSELSDNDKALNNLTLLMSINGTIGQLAFYSNESIKLGKSVAYIRFGNLAILSFYYGVLMTSNTQQYFNRRVTGTTIKNLGLNEIRNFKYPIPNGNEQDKIGKLIKSLATLITLQQRKLELLKEIKKGLLQKMFADKDSKRPVLRFKGFHDDWEQRKLGEISERILRKNSDLQSLLPLTISAQDGLVDQTIYFNKQVASKQLKNYLLLYNGDFAYNKSYSVGYPYGAIKRLDKYKQGVLSTLYIAFKPTNINSDFLQHYYDTDKWYREIYRNAAEGARNHGLLNISANDFFNSKLITPSDNDEQLKIAKIINVFNRLITLQQQKLAKYQSIKKSLLQQMFI